MKLTDAIANADSAYVIQFLLIAYLEALRQREPATGLSEELTALPLQGLPDIRNRAARLKSETAAVRAGAPDARIGQLDEMRDVFAVAVTRLDSLFAAADLSPKQRHGSSVPMI
jgi:hypothetical protein